MLNQDAGGVISNLGSIRLANGTKIAIADLSFQPGTGTMFGYRGNADGAGKGGELYTIDKTTGIATLLGRGGRGTGGGLAFAPDGTLYAMHNTSGFKLSTLNPANGASLTTLEASVFLDGLAVRPSDGDIFGTRGNRVGGDGIFTITPLAVATFIGATGVGIGSDLDFQPIPALGAVLLGLIGLGTVCGWRRRN